jgi:hypothetical protein
VEHISRTDVDRIAAAVSEGLPEDHRVFAQGRNGYTGLDLYVRTVNTRTLFKGTKREVYQYLQGMRQAHLIVSDAASRDERAPYHPDERAQLALGELGEALMHDGSAAEAYISRAVELLSGRLTP